MPTRAKLGVLIKGAVSAVILGVLLWRYASEIPSLREVKIPYVALAVGLLLFQPPLIGWRWWVILCSYQTKISLKKIIAFTWISIFANQFMPASIGGDAIRILALRRAQQGLGSSVASVVVDRIAALVALLILIIGLGFWLGEAVHPGWLVGLAAALLACGAFFVALIRSSKSLVNFEAGPTFLKKLSAFLNYMTLLVEAPAAAIKVVTISLIVHFLSLFAFYSIVKGLGVQANAVQFFAIAAALTFIQMIPLSIGGWGIREIASVTMFSSIGVGNGEALLASITLGFCYAIASLPGAAIWPFLRISPKKSWDSRSNASLS